MLEDKIEQKDTFEKTYHKQKAADLKAELL